ncbi:unnamed protein product, partial [marine sediment metagenome]
AYLDLGHVSGWISGNIVPSAQYPAETTLIRGNPSVYKVEVQDNYLAVLWNGFVESMYQALYLPAGL